ncbi:GIY-YIG nuclease family protein [Pragia fontium]|uniref:Endonuclease n=1 Tax=Pragia fontium DSM 5563 = ATCC 49100 TaxID=1122977 RepID=A0AAJ5BGH5_9GAMM|nr:GIY-YIG nuclease family protein [Pragia fontium]SFC42963.1 putative endonuclease [Pragia fontium DSM 5563 = ATCC 49100]
MKQPCVYILASRPKGALYVGVTSNLPNRIECHQRGEVLGFTQKYNIKRLVWYELHSSMYQAITREKNIKHWRRIWKIELIENMNPDWDDLSKTLSA